MNLPLVGSGLRGWRSHLFLLVFVLLVGSYADNLRRRAHGQETPPATPPAASDAAAPAAGKLDAEAALNSPAEEKTAAKPAAQPALPDVGAPSLWSLLIEGGFIGVPIFALSLVAVAIAIERSLAFRRSKIMPDELLAGLAEAPEQGSFDPRKAYRLCQQYPSVASTIIRAMLLKVGRPHSEVEHAVMQASEREATRLYAPVRTINMAATVAPLLGLLGTVWGLILAFFVTSKVGPGVNKTPLIAEGVYVALVTTVEGLVVAIPCVMIAHWLEGRIQSLFLEIDELLFNLLPQVERYEGKLRVSRQQLTRDNKEAASGPAIDEADEARRAAASAK